MIDDIYQEIKAVDVDAKISGNAIAVSKEKLDRCVEVVVRYRHSNRVEIDFTVSKLASSIIIK